MRGKIDSIRLQNDKNYHFAFQILENLKERICPDIKLLNKLYGKERAQNVKFIIEKHLLEETKKIRIIRKHNPNVKFDIYNARKSIEKNLTFQKIHKSLLIDEIPLKNDMEMIYGDYSEKIIDIFRIYIENGLKRKCELGAATHLNRVGAVAFQIGLNEPGSFKYSAIAALHDAIEDLLYIAKYKDGKILGILNYNNFIELYIPFDLFKSVQILTNHYDLILKYTKDRLLNEDKYFSKRNVIQVLIELNKTSPSEIKYYIDLMLNCFENFNVENDFIDNAKWFCYTNLYMDGITSASQKANDFRLFEIKGIDLSDNAQGKDSLGLESRIRNIIKNSLWGIKGYSLNSDWEPLNRHIEEILEESLYSAENMIIKDLLENQSVMDFLESALIKYKKLETVFYTN
jgi:hypothetical protein